MPADEAALVEDRLRSTENQLNPVGPMSESGVLGARTFEPDSWWVFDLG